jgi:hypothetical protein
MLRSLFISCFLTGSAMSLIPVQKPPSSLLPQSGKVAFTHQSQKTIGCSAKGKGKDLKCVAELANADSSTFLTLRPVKSADPVTKDVRENVSVSLPRANAAVDVTLSRGVWELDWPPRRERERFFVEGGDDLAIGLSTQMGSCKRTKDECSLVTEGATQKVSIPRESRR